jgi:hypothetical protein
MMKIMTMRCKKGISDSSEWKMANDRELVNMGCRIQGTHANVDVFEL